MARLALATALVAMLLAPGRAVDVRELAEADDATAAPSTSTMEPTTTVMKSSKGTTSATTTRATTTTVTTITATSTTTATTTSTTGICFEDNVAWAPLDMGGQNMTQEPDAYACQRRCAAAPGCTHFSFFKTTMDCHLQDAFAIRQPDDLGFLSGPFSCWGGIPHQDQYVDLGNKTYVRQEFGCLEMGVLYSPILGTPKYFKPQDNNPQPGSVAIHSCQEECADTEGCAFFTVQFPARLCRLSGSGAQPLYEWENAVSGPRYGCQTQMADAVQRYDFGQTRLALSGVGSSSQNLMACVIGLLAFSALGGTSLKWLRWRREGCSRPTSSPPDAPEVDVRPETEALLAQQHV